MLVLTRHIGESIVISDDIEITVVEIQGDKIRIGINAPRNITILRKELIDEAKKANTAAAAPQISLGALAKAMKKPL
jgi:carbon storage regulator